MSKNVVVAGLGLFGLSAAGAALAVWLNKKAESMLDDCFDYNNEHLWVWN